MTQIIFSQEALIAMKNKKKFDFMNSDFTPTSIDLYKKKVYWVDLDLNTKIKNNFVKLDEEVPEFELIHKDDELIFRIKTPHQGSTLVCDFPFRKLELDEDGLPVKTICEDSDDVEYKGDDSITYLLNETKPFTGKNVCKHWNGQILNKGNYKDGKRNGKWTWWHENGQKWSEGNIKDDKLDGKWTDWHENGQKWSEGNIKDDKLDGKWTFWKKNGQKEEDRNYKDGNLVGETKYSYYENGQMKLEKNYKYDKLDGKYTRWHDNGQKSAEVNYKDGKQDGKTTWWLYNGQIKSEKYYKDGVCISGDC
jgi:antitoxin component YwqK of YwqJK toxin-antitoxin module